MRTATRVTVIVLGAVGAVIFARTPEIPPGIERAEQVPAETAAADRVPESVSVWQVDPRPDGAGPWVVYMVGSVSCCDEHGAEFGPVPVATCVPAAELEAGLPEHRLTFWEVPVPDGNFVQDEACPDPPRG